jgi:hypothetical protein
MRLGVWLAWVWVVAGCESPVEIIGHCEPLGEPVRVVAPEDTVTGLTDSQSVGLLDGWALVSWDELIPVGESVALQRRSRWVDPFGQPSSDILELGHSQLSYRSRWVAHEGALHAQVWADPETDPLEPPEPRVLYRWRLEPPPAAGIERRRIHVAAPETCLDCARLTLGTNVGVEGQLPTAIGFDEVWSALISYPATCQYDVEATGWNRLHVVRGEGATEADPVLWGDDPCDLTDRSLAVGAPWLVPLSDGTLGVLLRGQGGGDGKIRYTRLTQEGQVMHPPRIPAGSVAPSGAGGGAQPRGVAVPGEHVLFTERRRGERCHAMRRMGEDGSSARDAPWQLPCFDSADRQRISSVELETVPGAAVVVWGQRTEIDSPWVTPEVGYEEGIFASLLTPRGQRGSEVVEVTDPDATALHPNLHPELFPGPVPVDYVVATAAEGDEVVVTWADRRPWAPGIYMRRLRCTVGAT